MVEGIGILAADAAVRINGKAAKEIDPSQLGELLRGSPVKIAIARDGVESEITMSLD